MKTNYRILLNIDDIKYLHGDLPPTMELMPDGKHIASYLTEKDFKTREGILFPICPITGEYGIWDWEYNSR